MEASKNISVRIPLDDVIQIETITKREGRTQSQVIQLAVAHYLYLYRIHGKLSLDHLDTE